VLLDSLRDNDHAHGGLGVELARALIAAGQEDDARRLLEDLRRTHSSFQLPARWLEVLSAPRTGRVALRERVPRREDAESGRSGRRQRSGRDSRRSGMFLDGMLPVWVFEHVADMPSTSALLTGLCVAGVAPLIASGTLDERTWYAVEALGTPLESNLDRKGGMTRESALRVCSDLVAILGGLAQAGVHLPDPDLRRFDQDQTGRVWLVDLRGATREGTEVDPLNVARTACRTVLDMARRFVPPAGLPDELDRQQSFPDLLRSVQVR